MAESHILDGYLPTEKQRYVPMRTVEDKQFPKAVSRKDVAVGALALLSLYLLTGNHADKACSLVTSVPVAIFTYKVLSHSNTSQQGYHSILYYWSLYGVLAIFDAIFQQSPGYFFGKFVLLAAVFGHAAHSNRDILTNMIGEREENEVEVEDKVVVVRKQPISIISRYDSEGYPIESPVPTAFSFGESVYMEDPVCPIHSVNNDDMMSTQHNSEDLTPQAEGRTAHHGINRVLTRMSKFQSRVRNLLKSSRHFSPTKKLPCPEAVLDDFPLLPSESASTAFPIHPSQADESSCTVGVQLAYGDIITNPMEQIVLKTPGEAKHITAVNVSTENIMWALKSNALNYLGASPACGVIPSGGKMTIRVVLHEGYYTDVSQHDKLAIDYVKVGSQREYTTDFVTRLDKKRHLMRIVYDL